MSSNHDQLFHFRAASKVKPKYSSRHIYDGRVPVDDVYIRCQYPQPQHSFVKAMRMHREMASPEMMDNRDGMIDVDLWLNMKTKKKVTNVTCFNYCKARKFS